MLTYHYQFVGMYHEYESDTTVRTFGNLTTHPSDESATSVQRALHDAMQHYYTRPGYWSPFTSVRINDYQQ
jgi:hypothetical protein